MANQLGFYYRPKLTTGKFYDITENILHTTLNWSQSTANELLEFTFDVNVEPLDDDDNPFTLLPGDEIIVTTDQNRDSIFRGLAGIIIDPNQQSIGSWNNTNSRGDNRYSVTVRQKDFSKSEITLDYKTPITLNNLMTAMLANTDDNLGGIDYFGNPVPKFVLNCPNVDIASADFKGKEIDAIKNTLGSLGYSFRMVYFPVKDVALNLLRYISQIEIFQKSSPPVTSTFALGISNQDINYGMVVNPSYDAYDVANKPYLLLGESNFNVQYDFDSIINKITLIGMVQNGNTLKRWERTLGEQRQSDFSLGYKYKDIIFVARLLNSVVSTDAVPTFSPNITFSIDEFVAEKIENYDQLKADFLVMRIVHESVEYFYKFTVTAGIVTLGELAYGSTALSEAVSYGDEIELVKSVTIYEDNREFLEGYGDYGVIKNCSLENSEATLKFLPDDMPRAFDTVIAYGYKLENYLETHNFYQSQKAYGVRPHTEQIDFPLVLDQLQNILTVLADNSEPFINITFTSLRPEDIQAGWEFPVNVTGKVNGIYIVTSVQSKYISPSGEQGQHLVENQITMGLKRESLQDTIARYRRSYDLAKTVLQRGNDKDIFREELFFDFSFSGSVRLPAPTGLTASDIGESTVTLSWDEVSGTRVYHIYLSDDGGTTWLPGYGSGGLFDVFVVDLPDPDNPSIDLIDLPLTTEITAFVTAEDLYGESVLSDSEVFETGGEIIPSVPTGLEVTSWDNTSAEFIFDLVSGATYYAIYVYQNGVAIEGYDGAVIYDNIITGLLQNTKYTIRILAGNAAGESDLSDPVSFRTKIEKILVRSNKAITARAFYTLYDSNGLTKETKITDQYTYAEGALDWWARVSPDGTKIVYSRETATNTGAIFIKSLIDGSEIPASPSGATNYWYPAWNPADLDHIYCWKNPNSASCILVKINILTLTETIVYSAGTSFAYDLDFKDDGSECLVRIGFTTHKLNTASWTSVGSFTGQMARYNHDETKIHYIVSVSGTNQLFECNLDTTGQTQKTTNAGNKYNPTQQPTFPYSISYYYDNSGDVETWRCSSSFLGHEVIVDSAGNSELPVDWALIQYPLEQTNLAMVSNKETRAYTYLKYLENGLEERLTSQNSATEETVAISPDGSKIVIQQGNYPSRYLYLVDTYTSQITLISETLSDHDSIVFHPTLNKVLFSRVEAGGVTYAIFEMNLDTKTETRLFRNGSGNIQARYSTDFTQIFYTQQAGTLLKRANIDGSSEITFGDANSKNPLVLSNGKILYSELISSFYQIVIKNQDGTGKVQLTSSSFNKDYCTLGIDGKIYYQLQNGSDYQIWRMNVDGTSQELYSNNSNATNEYPRSFGTINPEFYSGDFKLVASNYQVRQYMYQLLPSGYLKKITPNFTYPEVNASATSHAKFSPDGRYIAYSAEYLGSGNDQIMLYDRVMNIQYCMTYDTSNQYLYPTWNPSDNNTIYYSDDSTNGTVSSVNINTKQKTTHRTGSTSEVIRNMVFSPDGNYLYLNLATIGNFWWIGRLTSSNLSGSMTTFVTRGSGIQIREMTWKPDGSKMCFSSFNGSNLFSLYECNADGSGVILRKNAVSSNNVQSPVYSPDGGSILFRYGNTDLTIQKADTTYDMSGYFANESTLLNNSGNFVETPLDWKIV